MNVPGIAGFGRACEIAAQEMSVESAQLITLRDHLWDGLRAKISGIKLNGSEHSRMPGNLNVYIPGALGSALMMSNPDIAFSSASACSEADGKPSHVLREMGLTDDQSACSVRFGIGRNTTLEEIDYTIAQISKSASELRQVYFETNDQQKEMGL